MEKYIVNINFETKINATGQVLGVGVHEVSKEVAMYFQTTGNRVTKTVKDDNGAETSIVLPIRSVTKNQREQLIADAFPVEEVQETEEVVELTEDEKKILELQAKYKEVLGKDPAGPYKNKPEWLQSKIDEAIETEEVVETEVEAKN